MTIVYIRWRDACHSMSQYAIKDLGELSELHEIGFLLKETSESVTIGTESQDGATEARMWLTIPRQNIIEMKITTLDKAFAVRKPRTKKVATVNGQII